jgi:hypothetical protein
MYSSTGYDTHSMVAIMDKQPPNVFNRRKKQHTEASDLKTLSLYYIALLYRGKWKLTWQCFSEQCCRGRRRQQYLQKEAGWISGEQKDHNLTGGLKKH